MTKQLFRKTFGKVQVIIETLFDTEFMLGVKTMDIQGMKMDEYNFDMSGFYSIEIAFIFISVTINIENDKYYKKP